MVEYPNVFSLLAAGWTFGFAWAVLVAILTYAYAPLSWLSKSLGD